MEYIYRYILGHLPIEPRPQRAGLHLLDAQEQAELRRLRHLAMALGFCVSLVSNALLFAVYYAFPQFFPIWQVTLPLVEVTLGLEPIFWAWIGLVVVIELLLLVLLNLYSVHRVAVVTGFIHAGNREEQTTQVLEVALQVPARELSNYGIDPYQDVNRLGLFIFNSILRLKGTIAHRMLRMLLLRMLGRSALRLILDLSGVPVYGTINALGARRMQREAQVLILGRAVLHQIQPLIPAGPLDAAGEELLYDTLQYIAISKRDYHHNHLLLTKMLLEHYGVTVRERHWLQPGFEQRLCAAPHVQRQLALLIIILGFIFDGKISWRERQRIAALRRAGLLHEDVAQLQHLTQVFLDGKGVDVLLATYLPNAPLNPAHQCRPQTDQNEHPQ
ncbi:MAG: hypothetical protein EI684_13995 [Candidatus Viridilinea halotolerans]|uniref:Uncharacterized protein n=1 Tax=Candidatus Viridilinea halotolerans TaxID=2491704 RepID=A0A426TWR3_9CHLR|nr:MAG: hypothetical protein EI684_13995 [Candidatus Viridilinea halotolerans]